MVQGRTFSEMLQQAMRSCHNRAIATHEIIDELLNLAKEIRDLGKRHTELGLTEDELCFYDALALNNSAIEAMGIDELKVIAAELVTKVRKSVTIDWTLRESARSKIRVMAARIVPAVATHPTCRWRRSSWSWNRRRPYARTGPPVMSFAAVNFVPFSRWLRRRRSFVCDGGTPHCPALAGSVCNGSECQ